MIHPTAIVSSGALLGDEVTVGPYAIVEDDVVIGQGTRIDAHAVIRSGTRLGASNIVHSFAVLGGEPQDRRFKGEKSLLEIGDRNVFREHVTVHRGAEYAGGITRIGSGGLYMVGCHIAHDAAAGDAVILANATLLGGHVTLGDAVNAGGGVAIAPFVRVGRLAFLAGGAMIERDVPPFVIAAGDRARVRAINKVGLERAGVSRASQDALARAFRALYRSGTPLARAARSLAGDDDALVRELAAFVVASTSVSFQSS